MRMRAPDATGEKGMPGENARLFSQYILGTFSSLSAYSVEESL